MFALKGWLFVAIGLILTATVYSQDASILKKPLVSGATDVPVLGGSLGVFGLNFGDDPSVIKVLIHNYDNSVFQCTDVQIVKPNTAISCTITDIGTGSAKHIEVVVNGVPNAEDTNLAFKRSAPLVNKLTYSDGPVVRLYGHDFGFNPELVVVKLDGVDHSVIDVNDSVITCKKHGSYYVYDDEMAVYVEVDNQTTTASLDALFEPEKLHGFELIEQDIEQPTEAERYKYKTIILVFIPVVAAVALLAGFLVVKRRRTMLAARTPDVSSVEQAGKGDNSAIMVSAPGPLVRESSMEEIDLNATNTLTTSQASQPRDRDDDDDAIYELHRSDSSSSFSSLSSTYSSTNCTPCYTPDAPSSPKLDSFEFSHSSDTDNSNSNESNDSNSNENNTGKGKKRNKRSERRERFMNKLQDMAEPISRLGKRSMDSPYFTKQTGFDSPLTTSQELTPRVVTPSRGQTKQRISQGGFDSPLRSSQEMTPKTPTPSSSVEHNGLHDSQEINQRHASPFDSACVLHSAIQRAAILRAQQSKQQSSKQQAAQPVLQGRRASLAGAGHPKHASGRRSSLGTSSLHVTALHNSTGIMKLSERQHQPKQQRSLRKTQYIHQFDEELVEGDE